MLTIFTVPLPFQGQDEISQHNSIESWMNLAGKPEIILIGNEFGVSSFAKKYGLVHIPTVEYTVDGHISIRSVFEIGQREATYDIMALVDADNILMNNFVDTISLFENEEKFMLGGYRRAIRISETLSFAKNWQRRLRRKVIQHGRLYNKKAGAGSDYSVFRKGLFKNVPDFSLGKGHWDGWRMWYALEQGCELVDCTDKIFAVHQNHPWRRWRGGGSKRNLDLAMGKQKWVFDSTRKL